MSIQKYLDALEELKTRSAYRVTMVRENGGLDFSSNDFLGLANHAALKRGATKAIREMGCSASGSRLVTGTSELHERVERQLAEFAGREAATLFSSGYMANVGVLSALLDKSMVVLADRLCHASLLDGASLSGARLKRFRHNDMGHLESLLEELPEGTSCLVMTESVFSMDGDCAPLADLVDLKSRYDALLLVDEAHAVGVFGDNLSGLARELGLQQSVDILVGTLGKGAGCFGAYVAGDAWLREWLVNKARSFIYSTAPPPGQLGAIEAALALLPSQQKKSQKVLKLADHFRTILNRGGISTLGSCSQIVPVVLKENSAALAVADTLQKEGFLVLAMRPPTVAPGTARLRVVINAKRTKSEVASLAERIVALFNDVRVQG